VVVDSYLFLSAHLVRSCQHLLCHCFVLLWTLFSENLVSRMVALSTLAAGGHILEEGNNLAGVDTQELVDNLEAAHHTLGVDSLLLHSVQHRDHQVADNRLVVDSWGLAEGSLDKN